MKALHIAAALACALLLAGCLPVTSKTPIGTTVGLGADTALTGTWKGHSQDANDKTDGFFHFMQAKDGSLTVAVILAAGGSDDGWTIFNAHSAALGKNRFLNAVETFDKDAPADGDLKNANIPLLYVLKGRTLTLYLLDEDKTKQAVKAGKIKGTIEPGDSGDVVITADAAELDAFMAKPEAVELFKVLMVLKRVD
jgi:major membrane immunogen (membrane-anchored lipoprotein)